MSDAFNNHLINKLCLSDGISLIYKDTAYSYQELHQEVCAAVSFLNKYEVVCGTVVAIVSDYSFTAIAVFLAALEVKAVVVPITNSVQDEIHDRLTESYANIVITVGENGLQCEQSCPSEKHHFLQGLKEKRHAGLILFSSGTTGKPKAMIHDLDNLVEIYKDKKNRTLTMLVFLMFDHIGGINTLLNALSMGATIVIPESRDADYICGLVERYSINVLPSSPTFLNLILISEAYRRHDISSLRMITYGTETMPESLLDRIRIAFPKVKLLQTFGTSETGIAQTSSKSSASTLMKIDDRNLETKIVDGELWLRSKTQILGYLNASMESFTEDGWFKTGDLVETETDGFIRIIGRSKEVINVGGEKLVPAEVESVLMEMPDVVDCLVYAERNAITGQSVVADLMTKLKCTPQEMKKAVRAFCKERLAAYKIPTRINIVDSISFGERFKKTRLKM
jgi:acyl-coenzyme A synthetase/AMP-(fatty) acid ligase